MGRAHQGGLAGRRRVDASVVELACSRVATRCELDMSSNSNMRLFVAIVATSVLMSCGGPPTAEIDERDTALAANVEAFARKLAASDEFSGVVLLTRHGQPLVRRGYGLADRKAGRPNTPETPFMLSSVSKMFTAVTIAKLVERKQLSFDSTLGSLLPDTLCRST